MNLAETYSPDVDFPRIWTRRPKILEARDPIVVRTFVEGRYTLRPWAPGRQTDPRRVLTFRNLITTQGLNQIGNGTSYVNRCAVGTGTNAADPSDTQLQSQIAFTTTVNSNTAGNGGSDPDFYGYRTKVFRFSQGAAAGNLAEVGVGPGTSGTVAVFSRARILDSEGNPTTLTVLQDEFLDVTYEFRIYVAGTADVEDSVEISGVSYDTTTRPALVGTNRWQVGTSANQGGISETGQVLAYATQTLGAITDGPSGTSFSRSSVTNSTYSNGDFHRTGTCVWGLNAGNTGSGIGSMLVQLGLGTVTQGLGAIQVSFDPVIPKTNELVLSLPIRHEWARKDLS